MMGFHDPLGLDQIRTYGKELGKDFACIRVYMRPSHWGTVTAEFARVVRTGKLAVASHKPPAVPDAWAKVVSGGYDAEIAAIVDAHGQAGRETIFIFNHEPHEECSDIGHAPDRFRGTSAEYRAAHQYIVEKFRAAGATNVRFGYSGTDPGIFAATDLCYPGDGSVDVLCHDLYNWGDFRSQRDSWTEFNDPTRWPRAVELARAANKPLLIGEVGCHPSAPTHPTNPRHDRDQWFRNAARYLRTDPVASRHVIGLCYFHSPPPRYDFQFLRGPSAPDGRQGWIEGFAEGKYFTSDPFPVAVAESSVT